MSKKKNLWDMEPGELELGTDVMYGSKKVTVLRIFWIDGKMDELLIAIPTKIKTEAIPMIVEPGDLRLI